MAPIITSIKNIFVQAGSTSGSQTNVIIAKAVTSPSPTVSSDTSHGCLIKAIWISLDACGTLGSGVANSFMAYLMKNPGDNLSPPAPESLGTSNEKKFAIKVWRAMVMANSDGNNPYHWEGWLKIPKRYQRMGTDDTWEFSIENTVAGTGLFSLMALYKWYR